MKSKTIQNLVIASIVLVVTSGAAISLLWFISKNSVLLTEQLNVLKDQNQQESSLLRMQRLANETEDERLELAKHFLQRESDSIIFLSEIESLAPKIGLELETEELKQLPVVDNTSWIESSFLITGSRSDIERFVQILELLPYVSRISSVSMNALSGSNWQAAITVQVQLLKYDE